MYHFGNFRGGQVKMIRAKNAVLYILVQLVAAIELPALLPTLVAKLGPKARQHTRLIFSVMTRRSGFEMTKLLIL